MTLILLNTIIITLFISCLTAASPLALGVTILLTAVGTALILALISTRWFGFITFIIYVGGMLVIFAYFAALQPNQQIIRWGWLLTPIIIVIVLISTTKPHTLLILYIKPATTDLYIISNLHVPLLLALILFLALIIVVKTSHAGEGPLRPFDYVQTSSKSSPRY